MHVARALFLLVAMIAASVSAADAVSVAMRVSGDAGGNGMVDIIIQDNDQPNRIERAIYQIDVTILGGNTAEESAQAVRDTLEAELPGFYKAFVFDNTTVVISQPGEIVDFQVTDDVPGQLFEIVPVPEFGRSAPAAAPITLGVAACAMAAAAAFRLRRRRSGAARP
jgi:hypothetical protein